MSDNNRYITTGQAPKRRQKIDPAGTPRITRYQVIRYAKSIKVTVHRVGQGRWLFQTIDGKWRDLAQTSYRALENLKNPDFWKAINETVDLEKKNDEALASRQALDADF